MCCCLFWIVYSRHLAVLVCELMGVQSIWLPSLCSPFGANPPFICMDPSVSAERCALKPERQKFPRQPLQIILCSVIILKRGTQKYKQKVLVHLPADDSRSSFCPSFAKSELGNEWHLKARAGLLTPDFVWRSPCNSLWFRAVFIIPLLTLGVLFYFYFFFHLPLLPLLPPPT